MGDLWALKGVTEEGSSSIFMCPFAFDINVMLTATSNIFLLN